MDNWLSLEGAENVVPKEVMLRFILTVVCRFLCCTKIFLCKKLVVFDISFFFIPNRYNTLLEQFKSCESRNLSAVLHGAEVSRPIFKTTGKIKQVRAISMEIEYFKMSAPVKKEIP